MPQTVVSTSQSPDALTFTLASEQFTWRAADCLEAVLNTLMTRRCQGGVDVTRSPTLPRACPVLCCTIPGWTAFAVLSSEITEVGRSALQDALSTWGLVP